MNFSGGHIVLLYAVILSCLVTLPAAAQFLTPEETVKLPPPAEVPSAPITPPRAPPPQPQAESPASVPSPAAAESEGHFADFAAYAREQNIILTWHLTRGRTIDRRIQIYRFVEEPKVIHDISRGVLIAKLSGEINLYEDFPPSQGTYYYAIFVESTRGLEPASFNISRNLVGPVAFRSGSATKPAKPHPQKSVQTEQKIVRSQFESEEVGQEKEDTAETEDADSSQAKRARGINAVIRRTFFQGDYRRAVQELRPFLRNPVPQVRAKAMFYTGLCRYRLGQYDQALRYFNHPLTKKFYRRNAEFWISKTTENLR